MKKKLVQLGKTRLNGVKLCKTQLNQVKLGKSG